MSDSSRSRRDFLKRAGATLAAGAAGTVLVNESGAQERIHRLEPRAPREAAPRSANDRVRLGIIGPGWQGTSDTQTALRVPGVELVAAADVYDGRLVRAREVWGKHLFTTRDYRELLARPDVDAVIIATPDHWHARMAIDAMEAGKDVYVEKPMVHEIAEGLPVIEAARRTGRILQVGSQRVSSIAYAKAKELLAQGVIGKLNFIDVFLDRNSALGAWQYNIPPDASPANIDWDRFLGKAPRRPFEPMRLFRWRNYRDYGTGIPGDLFVHLFSGIHFMLDSLGPTRVMATGGLRHWNDGRDVPDVVVGIFDYPETDRHPAFNISMRVNFASGASAEGQAFRFVGPDGVLTLDRGVTVSRAVKAREPGYMIHTFPQALQEEMLRSYRSQYPPREPEMVPQHVETYLPPQGYNDHLDHFENFFEAVRSRRQPVEDAEFGFRAAGPALLNNLSFFERRPVHWDPVRMKLVKG